MVDLAFQRPRDFCNPRQNKGLNDVTLADVYVHSIETDHQAQAVA